MFYGELKSPPPAPVDWHVHELLYGFLPAIVAGFLLNAIPNWTGRLPIRACRCKGSRCGWRARLRHAVRTNRLLAAAVVDAGFLALPSRW